MKRFSLITAAISALLLFNSCGSSDSDGVKAKFKGLEYGDGLWAIFETKNGIVSFPGHNLDIEHLKGENVVINYSIEKVFFDPIEDSIDMKILHWIKHNGEKITFQN